METRKDREPTKGSHGLDQRPEPGLDTDALRVGLLGWAYRTHGQGGTALVCLG